MKDQLDYLKFIAEERRRQKITRIDFDKRAKTSAMSSLLEVVRGHGITIGFIYVLRMLDALGYTLVIEDKEANWGLDMRLRRMPKKLFVAERIESREHIRDDGFHARVDMFESPEAALKHYPKPRDIYEIYPHRLIRKHFDVNEHPFGTMYSYNNWVSPEYIQNRVTHR